nr:MULTISPECIES: XdhC family protein [unclassified Mesobacillus]
MVLATIILVKGSAYKKEGSMMLILNHDRTVGTLSAGCLEEDLNERAKQVWCEQQSCTVEYDLSAEDDLSWGQGAGCNGVITVLLEPVAGELRQNLLLLKNKLEEKQKVARIIRFTKSLDQLEDSFLVEDGSSFGIGEFFEAIDEGVHPYDLKKGLIRSKHDSDLFFIHEIAPKPLLYVFGAGKDARPLVSLASWSGFEVYVIDWRPAFCHHGNFPEAKELIVGHPEEVMKNLNVTEKDFVVVMTHQFQKDQYILSRLLNKPLFYLGVLGSRKRTQRLLGSERIPNHISSQVGLTIGADGPEEIAVSIVAEIIEKMRQTGNADS